MAHRTARHPAGFLCVASHPGRAVAERNPWYRLEMRAAFYAVALLALASLLVRASRIGLAGDYLDPVGRVAAQDEALYANSSIRLAREGGWLTPKFMGRYALYKPPLLAWTSGISARLLGIS